MLNTNSNSDNIYTYSNSSDNITRESYDLDNDITESVNLIDSDDTDKDIQKTLNCDKKYITTFNNEYNESSIYLYGNFDCFYTTPLTITRDGFVLSLNSSSGPTAAHNIDINDNMDRQHAVNTIAGISSSTLPDLPQSEIDVSFVNLQIENSGNDRIHRESAILNILSKNQEKWQHYQSGVYDGYVNGLQCGYVQGLSLSSRHNRKHKKKRKKQKQKRFHSQSMMQGKHDSQRQTRNTRTSKVNDSTNTTNNDSNSNNDKYKEVERNLIASVAAAHEAAYVESRKGTIESIESQVVQGRKRNGDISIETIIETSDGNDDDIGDSVYISPVIQSEFEAKQVELSVMNQMDNDDDNDYNNSSCNTSMSNNTNTTSMTPTTLTKMSENVNEDKIKSFDSGRIMIEALLIEFPLFSVNESQAVTTLSKTLI